MVAPLVLNRSECSSLLSCVLARSSHHPPRDKAGPGLGPAGAAHPSGLATQASDRSGDPASAQAAIAAR